MAKFKKGDRVRRIGVSFGDATLGDEYTVRDGGPGFVTIEGSSRLYDPDAFVLAEPEKPKAPAPVKATL
ncbi:hypothetical protein SB719_20050, partial [Pantoea sp. SIMBA_079]|uniref:hypothetical protein n=1 Tax=Pantoea sp. SIMBA_079 TaxID=3085817 RepID=UPI0039941E1F